MKRVGLIPDLCLNVESGNVPMIISNVNTPLLPVSKIKTYLENISTKSQSFEEMFNVNYLKNCKSGDKLSLFCQS